MQIVKGDRRDCAVCGSQYVAKCANQRTCCDKCSRALQLETGRLAGANSYASRARRVIWERDGCACFYCGSALAFMDMQTDHVVAVCRGGVSLSWNLVSSCGKCNRDKHSKRLDVKREKQIIDRGWALRENIVWTPEFTRALQRAV